MHGGKSIVFHATFHGGQDVVVKARMMMMMMMMMVMIYI